VSSSEIRRDLCAKGFSQKSKGLAGGIPATFGIEKKKGVHNTHVGVLSSLSLGSS
jgi:hypothetical protein